jgi:hypothetical protein
MIEIHCALFNKVYKVKKICLKHSEIPNNANMFYTAYTNDINKTVYDIYMTINGVLYAKKNIVSN